MNGVSASAGVATYHRPQTPGELVAEAGHGPRRRPRGRRRTVQVPAHPPRRPRRSRPRTTPTRTPSWRLAEALNERDRYTGEHSEEVVDLVAGVARGLGLNEQEIARVKVAALLHDIGKVAIPDGILNKPGKLDEDEWKLMREHPVIGERILRAIPGMGSIARIVRHEHERFDGAGYPDGISGDEIPIGSRIILACDAYHAMTSDRPYRKAMPHAEAVRELAANAGTQFDPQVTEVLIGALYGSRKPSSRRRGRRRLSAPTLRYRLGPRGRAALTLRPVRDPGRAQPGAHARRRRARARREGRPRDGGAPDLRAAASDPSLRDAPRRGPARAREPGLGRRRRRSMSSGTFAEPPFPRPAATPSSASSSAS